MVVIFPVCLLKLYFSLRIKEDFTTKLTGCCKILHIVPRGSFTVVSVQYLMPRDSM